MSNSKSYYEVWQEDNGYKTILPDAEPEEFESTHNSISLTAPDNLKYSEPILFEPPTFEFNQL